MLGVALPQWLAAMKACFIFELSVRILAQKRFPKESIERDIGDRGKSEGLLSLLFREWTFTTEERDFLPVCNKLRNKLIHCEPDVLYKIVQELDPTFHPPPRVTRVKLPGDLSTVEPTHVALVKDTTTREDGFVGWMMEAASNGTFAKAMGLLKRGSSILQAKSQQENP